jgi:hypothetical protein
MTLHHQVADLVLIRVFVQLKGFERFGVGDHVFDLSDVEHGVFSLLDEKGGPGEMPGPIEAA